MRFTDEQGGHYILAEGEWVFDGDRMVTVSASTTKVQMAAELVDAEHPALVGDCGVAQEYGALTTYAVISIAYADDNDAAGGTVVPTIPGPAPEQCCDMVVAGNSKCSTEVKVEVI